MDVENCGVRTPTQINNPGNNKTQQCTHRHWRATHIHSHQRDPWPLGRSRDGTDIELAGPSWQGQWSGASLRTWFGTVFLGNTWLAIECIRNELVDQRRCPLERSDPTQQKHQKKKDKCVQIFSYLHRSVSARSDFWIGREL